MPKCNDCGNKATFKGEITIISNGSFTYGKSNSIDDYITDDVIDSEFKANKCGECGSKNIE